MSRTTVTVDCGLQFDLGDAEPGPAGLSARSGAHLNGPARYTCPHYLSAESLEAELFGRPARIAADSDEDSVDLRFTGAASESDVYRLIDASRSGAGNRGADFRCDPQPCGGRFGVDDDRDQRPVGSRHRSARRVRKGRRGFEPQQAHPEVPRGIRRRSAAPWRPERLAPCGRCAAQGRDRRTWGCAAGGPGHGRGGRLGAGWRCGRQRVDGGRGRVGDSGSLASCRCPCRPVAG